MEDVEERERWDGSIGSEQTGTESQPLLPGEVIQGLNPVPLCSGKLELACWNPPAMNLLEQKRVWDGDEENIGVFSTPADSCSSLQKGAQIFHKSL